MNTTPIQYRISFDIKHCGMMNLCVCRAYLDGDVLVEAKHKHRAQAIGLAEWKLADLLKEWKCQDQTSNTELKCRKTIISSCGRLKVTESLV